MTTPDRLNPFGARDMFESGHGRVTFYRLRRLEEATGARIDRLPFTLRVLLESLLRHCDGRIATEEDVRRLATWSPNAPPPSEVPFHPARVLLQDFTGVPCLADLAAMRDAARRLGANPARVNPLVPVDLVIDHSVQVDVHGVPDALARNLAIEFRRNRERYAFLRWAQQAFRNVRIVPPAAGIIHQVNLEYLARVVLVREEGGPPVAMPDSCVGTDSHTTMINGLGVLGWGVGGIEAEAVMLGQPCYLPVPRVVGVQLHGEPREGTTPTDLALTVTQVLRRLGVVDAFVEFFGPALSRLSLPDRATIANMAPEYGATTGFFPVDAETIRFLRQTDRPESAALAERYCKEQGLFRTEATPDPAFSDVVKFDLGTVEPCLAGPKRPQDRVALKDVQASFRKALTAPVKERGYGLTEEDARRSVSLIRRNSPASITLQASVPESNPTRVDSASGADSPCACVGGDSVADPPGPRLGHGAVVLASITSCTNTSNPIAMLAAGLLARNAVRRGLRVPPHVKTSLAPGSRAVTRYIEEAGLLRDLETLGFAVVGYGCMTCIGNSGPLPEPVANAVREGSLVAASVLSGNRNFEGRIHPLTRANYLASPPLVVAYALAGTVDTNLTSEPIGTDGGGKPVTLKEIWPSAPELAEAASRALRPEIFRAAYAGVFSGGAEWDTLPAGGGDLYPWDPTSTYIQEPPFFRDLPREPAPTADILGARVLGLFGDSVTTDHISPAGTIDAKSPAGRWLRDHGVPPDEFHSYGARRGNDQVMIRGAFDNLRLKNLLVPGSEGNVTVHVPSGDRLSFFDAAMRYRSEGVPLLLVAGKEYGTGSSRDWAAKGTRLLGIRAVLAESFERIHRSNLAGMGVLPLQFLPGASAAALGLDGREMYSVTGLSAGLRARGKISVAARKPDGSLTSFEVLVRLDTPVEVECFAGGGILPTLLRHVFTSRGNP